MKARWDAPCVDCGQYWDRHITGRKHDYSLRCPKCKDSSKRRKTRERVGRWRKSKTTPPSKRRGGGSISEGDTILSPHKNNVKKAKSISRVAEGREGRGNPPLADRTLPPLELLEQHNRRLYDRVLAELKRLNAAFGETPGPVITGVTTGKK